MTFHKIFIKDIWEKHGDKYYFKGKPISSSKKIMIQQLRQNFKEFNESEKEKFKDEWAVINYEYIKTSEATKRGIERQRQTRFFKPQKARTKLYNKATANSLTIEMYRQAWMDLTNLLQKNKMNYDLINARINKIEEEIKAILQRMKR